MARTTSIQTPVYAVVGAGDLAVEKLREVRLPKADVRAAQDKVKAAPGRAQAAYVEALTQANAAVSQAGTAYADLAARGKHLVSRVRGQQATPDLEAGT